MSMTNIRELELISVINTIIGLNLYKSEDRNPRRSSWRKSNALVALLQVTAAPKKQMNNIIEKLKIIAMPGF